MSNYFLHHHSRGSVFALGAIIFLGLACLIVIIFGIGMFAELTGNNSGAPSTSGFSSLTCPAGMDPVSVGQCLDSYMKSTVPSSPLIGYGATFAQAGKQYNVNPALMVAIGQQESSLATKGKVVNDSTHNYYGMTKKGGGWASYASWEEAITNHARYLRESYLEKGLGTIPQIGAKYCPVGAANDPTGLNGNWVPGVTKHFEAILAKCPALRVTTLAGSKDIVQIAASQLGIKESGGKDCGEPTKYTGGRCLPWCAAFVVWTYNQAGYSAPKIFGADELYAWFQKNQLAFARGSGTPQPGDIILFNTSHIGLVEYVKGDTVYTIEGNAGGGMVKRESYNMNSQHIVGYGRWKK